MLKIFNKLKPFIEDNYERISVRQYARIQGISPPTASKVLDGFYEEGLLRKEEDRQYIFYHANRDSDIFIDLSRIYWKEILKKSGLIDHLKKSLDPVIILFGSLSKAEVKKDSDVDIAIFTASDIKYDLEPYEKKLKRSIQLFHFKRRDDVENEELLNNILNGYIIEGDW